MPGPLQAILDVGNQDYYLNRSREFIADAQNGAANKRTKIENAAMLLILWLTNEEG